MDHIDRSIVDILQHNARLPVKEIASRVSLSSPAVCARIERLEKSGVLAGYQATINVTAIGYLVKLSSTPSGTRSKASFLSVHRIMLKRSRV